VWRKDSIETGEKTQLERQLSAIGSQISAISGRKKSSNSYNHRSSISGPGFSPSPLYK
jgi:hypothetical protein